MPISAPIALSPARALSRKVWLHAAAFLLALCALGLASGGAMAQDGKAIASNADEIALRAYALRTETVDRAMALAQDARRQKIQGSAAKDAKSLDDLAKGLSADPKAKALLEKHQISARDYLMTMIALMRAGYAAETKSTAPEDLGTNAANIEYVKANKERIATAMRGGADKATDKASSKPAAKPEGSK